MKKLLSMAAIFLFCEMAHGQVTWVNDLKAAQAIALSQNKLIVMDFWAVWCGPCKAMELGLWQHQDMAELSTHFILLKIDVDVDRAVAQHFKANAIPKVVVMDAARNVLLEITGYRDAADYLQILKSLPTDVSGINQYLLPFILNKDQLDDHYQLAYAYQQWGKKTVDPHLQEAIFKVSTDYFRKVAKKTKDVVQRENSELHMILNDAYAGNVNRALTQAEKLNSIENEEAVELKKFIQAYCYQCDGQKQLAEALKKEIRNTVYLAELEEF